MRLIKIDDLDHLRLSGPFLEAGRPPFAILSHTWSKPEDELSFQDMIDSSQHQHKKGFQKIRAFCQRAKQAGYHYAWVDTVCIDKTSSAELSEAINSMYAWYRKSEVCYVFLEDLPHNDEFTSRPQLAQCRWFTRGWTLQELLAPQSVSFFDDSWHFIGSREDLAPEIAGITGIDDDVLVWLPIRRVSVARRMSWASQRVTSWPEDLAYCLLGIFGVNMPMLYGEGAKKAFIRLQEEILRTSDDHSIFAWSTDPSIGVSDSGFWSLLAPSSAHFKHSRCYLPVRGLGNSEHSITSRGISLKALIDETGGKLAFKCRPLEALEICTLPVVPLRSGPNDYARVANPALPESVDFRLIKDTWKETQIFVRNDIHDYDFEDKCLINYIELTRWPHTTESGYFLEEWYPFESFDASTGMIQASPFPNTPCGSILCFEHRYNARPPFIVTLFADTSLGHSDCISRDIIGVYMHPGESNSIADLFLKFQDQIYNGQEVNLLGTVERIACNGFEAWKLNDQSFVYVSVRRGHDICMDSIAVAEIDVKASWSEIISQPRDNRNSAEMRIV